MHGPGGPRVGVSLLVGRARALGVPGLVLACWWVGWVLTWQAIRLQDCSVPGAGVHPLLGTARS